MTRLTQCFLVLVLLGAPLLLVGCGSSSTSKSDAAPGSHDGPSVKTDVLNASKLDLAPAVLPDGSVGTPDVGAGEVGPVVTPDAGADEVGSVVTPDAAVDGPAVKKDTGPVTAVDAAVDGQADAADGGDSADDSGAATDSSPIACGFQGGSVLSDLTLTKACSPYIIRDYIQVNEGAVLTIAPGVTLKFEDSVGISVGNADIGTLVAVGTAQDPITFTSAASPPLPGDWGAIRLFDGTTTGTKIAYARVNSCGADRSACIIGDGVPPNAVTIDHVTIAQVGPDSDGILEWDPDSNFVITNSTFSDIPDNKYAISVQAPSFAGIGANNTFNGGALIEIAGGTISSTTSWNDPGTGIAVTDNLLIDGPGNPILTISAGMTLMFAAANPPLEFSVGYSGPAGLVIAGSSGAGKRVAVTSLAASPDLGDWVGIEVWRNGSVQISYADISYAGSDGLGGGNLILENGNSAATIVVDHSSFTYSKGYGIYLDCADPAVTPLATVTLNAGITYAFNESDPTNAGNLSNNVGPGLSGSECSIHHHH